MPMIEFEYTENLDINDKLNSFIKDVHETLVKIIKVDLNACRTTVHCYQNYWIGDGDRSNAFIQLNIFMFPGRSDALKNKLGALLLEKINHQFSYEIESLNTQVRVYFTDIDTNHYYGLPASECNPSQS